MQNNSHAKVKIIWSQDVSDCETCGTNWDDGAIVYVNGECIMNRPAKASCTGGEYVEPEMVFRAILEALEVEIEEERVWLGD